MAALPKQALLALRPFVYKTAVRLLRDLRRRREADLVADFALPLSGWTLTELFGIPVDDRPMVITLALSIPPLASHSNPGMTRHDALKQLNLYLTRLLPQLVSNSAPSLLSRLVAVKDGAQPTMSQIAEVAIMLFVAGHEPAGNLISSSLLNLLQHPDLIAQLKAEPQLVRNATEEFIRYDNPVFPGILRYALTDCSLESVSIRRGDLIVLPVFAGGRDPDFCIDPESLSFNRDHTQMQNLAFGHGPHYCLGVPLAKLQLQTALSTFIRVLPNATLLDEGNRPVWSNLPVRALVRLPVATNPSKQC